MNGDDREAGSYIVNAHKMFISVSFVLRVCRVDLRIGSFGACGIVRCSYRLLRLCSRELGSLKHWDWEPGYDGV